MTLGKLDVRPETVCFAQLAGGEHAASGSKRFKMENANGGVDTRSWEIRLHDSTSSDGILVARLAIKDKKLTFQWQPAAGDQTAAGCLANCALRLSAESETHELTLRAPIQVTPFTVDLDRQMPKANVKLSDLPDGKHIKVEITTLKGFPNTSFDPSASMDATKGTAWLLLGKTGAERPLRFRFNSALKRTLVVTVAPYLQFSGQPAPPPERYVHSQVLRQVAKLAQEQQAIFQAIEHLKKLKDKTRNKRQQDQVSRQIALGEQQLKLKQEASEKAAEFGKIYTKLHGVGVIHYRVVYDADGVQVELARSDSGK